MRRAYRRNVLFDLFVLAGTPGDARVGAAGDFPGPPVVDGFFCVFEHLCVELADVFVVEQARHEERVHGAHEQLLVRVECRGFVPGFEEVVEGEEEVCVARVVAEVGEVAQSVDAGRVHVVVQLSVELVGLLGDTRHHDLV